MGKVPTRLRLLAPDWVGVVPGVCSHSLTGERVYGPRAGGEMSERRMRTVGSLEKENADLRTEVEGLQKDKARLDWLQVQAKHNGCGWICRNSSVGLSLIMACFMPTVREAIDQARALGEK